MCVCVCVSYLYHTYRLLLFFSYSLVSVQTFNNPNYLEFFIPLKEMTSIMCRIISEALRGTSRGALDDYVHFL